MASKVKYYMDLAEETAVQVTSSREQWCSFLNTAARLYKYSYDEQLLIYRWEGDVQIPSIELPEQSHEPIGKYGQMRRKYLEEYDRTMYRYLTSRLKLFPHLRKVDQAANTRKETILPQLMEKAGATEKLKQTDPVQWAKLRNTCVAQVEQIIRAELIYV